jgi:hypothetical protein
VLRTERAVVEDVREDEQAAVSVRLELEHELLAAPLEGDPMGCFELGDLAGPLHALEALARRRCPLDGRDEPARELLRVGYRPPDALD